MKPKLGRITLHFVSLNSLVMIWVHPEPRTDLQHNLFSFKYEKCPQMVFWRLLEGQKEKETKFSKKHFVQKQRVSSSWQNIAVVLHIQMFHFLQMWLNCLDNWVKCICLTCSSLYYFLTAKPLVPLYLKNAVAASPLLMGHRNIYIL